ncbi:golgi-to-ER traffic-like protein isoform X2 [Wolffia australiana]
MRRGRSERGVLLPPQEMISKLEKTANAGNFYEAQQMYKSIAARYAAAERYGECLDILQSGASVQLKNGQVTCGAELGLLLVENLTKGKFPVNDENLDRIRKIYKDFPRIPVPQNFGENDDVEKLSETIGAAKARVESCSSFLKAALKWSADNGGQKGGSPELHLMLAEYTCSESPELDMAKVSLHLIRGNSPERFASTLVNFMDKCYPGEDDLAIARAVLFRAALSIGGQTRKFSSCNVYTPLVILPRSMPIPPGPLTQAGSSPKNIKERRGSIKREGAHVRTPSRHVRNSI